MTSLSETLESRMLGVPLVVMLDVDGTLAPLVSRPEDAVVPADTRRALSALAGAPNVFVALVSGRAAADAHRLVGVPGVWTIGNHGCEVVDPSGTRTIDPLTEPFREDMAKAVRDISELATLVPGVIVEDKRWSVSVHYRLAAPHSVVRVRSAVEAAAAAHGLRIFGGKQMFDLRAPVDVDKGTAVLRLADELGALGAEGSLFFAGDDVTDEDAFRALRRHVPRAVTFRVADSEAAPTAAEFLARDPAAIRDILRWLAALRA